MTPSPPTRKKPARGVMVVPGQPTIVFLTVCVEGREPWLATPEAHKTLVRIWREEASAWRVGRYVLMPDHLHAFAGLADDSHELAAWVRFWKHVFAREFSSKSRPFQSGMWDTRMRSSRQYEEKWEYVRNNPVRHGLTRKPEEWPYSGEVFELGW